MKKRKIIPIITATFMAASLLIPNTAFAVSTAPKPASTNPDCELQRENSNDGMGGKDKTGGNMALTRMHYTSVKPGDKRYNELLNEINKSFTRKGVHCEEGSPIYATQTASGLFPAIDGKHYDSEVAITDPGNWSTDFPREALKRFVTNKRRLANYQGIKTQKELLVDGIDATSNTIKEINAEDAKKNAFYNDIDPDVQDAKEAEYRNKHNGKADGFRRANAVGLEAFCNIECDECEPSKEKCKPGECEPPETIPRRYFIDNPEYKHDRASRSDVAQKDMPMSWTMFDNSAIGTDGYPLNIQYSAEDAPSDGHIEKDVVINPVWRNDEQAAPRHRRIC